MELTYLKDKIIKKVLAYDNKDIRNYVARVISDTTGIPYSDLKDKLELVHPNIGSSSNIIDSTGDLDFKNDKRYFAIEVNYSKNNTKLKSITYAYQLTLRQLPDSKEYKHIKPITIININAYDLLGYGDFIYETNLVVKKYNVLYSDLIKIFDINLQYFENLDYNKIKEEEGLLKDLAMFVIRDNKFLSEIYKGDKELIMTKKVLEDYTKQFDEMFYNIRKELELNEQEALKEEAYKKAKKEVYEEAKKDGIEQGTKEKSIDIAKKMLAKGKPIEEIMEFITLSQEEIEDLK